MRFVAVAAAAVAVSVGTRQVRSRWSNLDLDLDALRSTHALLKALSQIVPEGKSASPEVLNSHYHRLSKPLDSLSQVIAQKISHGDAHACSKAHPPVLSCQAKRGWVHVGTRTGIDRSHPVGWGTVRRGEGQLCKMQR